MSGQTCRDNDLLIECDAAFDIVHDHGCYRTFEELEPFSR